VSGIEKVFNKTKYVTCFLSMCNFSGHIARSLGLQTALTDHMKALEHSKTSPASIHAKGHARSPGLPRKNHNVGLAGGFPNSTTLCLIFGFNRGVK